MEPEKPQLNCLHPGFPTSDGVFGYVDSHKGFVMQSSMIEQQRLQNIANLKFQMYNQTAQNLLMARAKVQLEAPVLVVIQPGMAPHKGSPSKVKLAMLWFILGALVCGGVLCWKAD